MIVQTTGLRHAYADHVAVDGIDLSVDRGQCVAVLGENGSGKTTLFRLLATLLPVQQGRVEIAGFDVARQPLEVRRRIGVVFQSPSLDAKLTVDENIACQAALYGIEKSEMHARRNAALARFGLTDRRSDECGKLSGGLRRRVELAKGLLHQPKVMLLDEPSTGLDPAARLELADEMQHMKDEGVAVMMTTHLMEEAERADRVILMSAGRIVADGQPDALRGELGRHQIRVRGDGRIADQLRAWSIEPTTLHGEHRFSCGEPGDVVPRLLDMFGDGVHGIEIGPPSLEDVFVAKTGRRFEAVSIADDPDIAQSVPIDGSED